MPNSTFEELLGSGVHFGHLKRKWNPNMAPYIFGDKKGIHIIDLNKTIVKLDEACNAVKSIAKSGRKIMFVATKKQAKEIVAEKAGAVNMPYITERWSGGMLTNFATVRKSIRKMQKIDKMKTDGTFENLSKRERLFKLRQKDKIQKNLGSIAELKRIPAAIFIVDIMKEHIALEEATKLNIPIFAMVDTNSDPSKVHFAIPSNDDASKSIELIMTKVTAAIAEGLSERQESRDKASAAAEQKAADKAAKDAPAPAADTKAADKKVVKEKPAPASDDKATDKEVKAKA